MPPESPERPFSPGRILPNLAPGRTDRILRLNAVLDRTGLSRSTLYRKMQNGTFPKNVRISTRCAGWRESAVEAWMRNPMCYEATDSVQT